MKRNAMVAPLLGALLLVVTACGSGGASEGAASEGSGLSLDQVRLAIDNDDYMNVMTWMVADEKYWPKLGFTKPAKVVSTPQYVAGLVGGDVWIVQGESDAMWSAIAEGSVPMTIVGVVKNKEGRELGIRAGVDPDKLEGLKISGGTVGDRNVSIGRHILEELGVDPDSMQWVSVTGGADGRLKALLAGQIDAAVLQPRNEHQLKESGGQIIHKELAIAPQEVWVVKSDTLEDHQDAVCAYLKGRIQAYQYAAAGEDHTENQDAIVKLTTERGLEPTSDELGEWPEEASERWALGGGATVASFDEWNQDMIDNGNVPEGFDWKEHVDFHCLTKVQKELGLKVQPGLVR